MRASKARSTFRERAACAARRHDVTEVLAKMLTQEIRLGERPGSPSGGLSALWIAALLLGAVVLSVIAALKAGALPALAAKGALGAAIPAFFGASFAAMRRDTERVRQARPYPIPREDDLARDDNDDYPARELDEVRRWRSERLERLGVRAHLRAVLAAEPAFSIHDLERLLGAGCPLATALRILEPD
jgi:hypothetical protein